MAHTFSAFNMPDPFSGPTPASPAAFPSTPTPTLYQPTPQFLHQHMDMRTSSTVPTTPLSIDSTTSDTIPQLTPPLPLIGTTLLIDAITVDRLANDFKLDSRHRANLHAFVRIGSANPPLTRTEIATKLYALASGYAFEEEFIRRDEARIKGNGDLQDVFADLKIRLEDTFEITPEQRTTIRCVAQDMIFEKNRTSFCHLFVEVMGDLRRKKTTLKMTNIFDLPGREKRLQSAVKKITSSVRNAFRQDIRDSITGSETKSLKTFTFDAAVKYKRGGPGEKADPALAIHNAILRRLAFENKALLGIEEAETEDSAEPEEGPRRKKQKAGGGRIAKVNHFWGRVDLFFEKELTARGTDLNGTGWKSYVEDTLQWDTSTFPDDDGLEITNGDSVQSAFMDTESGTPVAVPSRAQAAATAGAMHQTIVPGAQGSALFL
ncbi:hypothetical protein EV360DRAFT_90635 [Lentinula raphanica]|nr:hypothetical protein EV360DRAFT_90635 [Lentinula raphanica]